MPFYARLFFSFSQKIALKIYYSPMRLSFPGLKCYNQFSYDALKTLGEKRLVYQILVGAL